MLEINNATELITFHTTALESLYKKKFGTY